MGQADKVKVFVIDIVRIGHIVMRLPRRPVVSRPLLGVCAKAAGDVARLRNDVLIIITYGAAADVDGDITVSGAGIRIVFSRLVVLVSVVRYQLAIVGMVRRLQMGTDGTQSATTIDGAEHGAALDVHIDIAANHSGSQRIACEATATAEDVTIDVAGTPSTNLGTIADVHRHVA